MAVLVTGGAGYIGSHMTYGLLDRGEQVVVLDNFSTGVRRLVADAAVLVDGSVGDTELVRRLLRDHNIDAVIHFAGSVVVPESVADPLAYYANNTANSRCLIDCCIREGIKHFIFSSSAAVYGISSDAPIGEDAPTVPINPYGRSKLATEWMLEDVGRAHDFRHIALRYFNVAGADPLGRTGQTTKVATHLIKVACEAVLGRRREVEIFGADYPTRDGTGIRDYIHVSDLIGAHLLALDALRKGHEASVLNVGYGRGHSVREVLDAVSRVAGRTTPTRQSGRRPGDPAVLIADVSRLKRSFSWQPRFDDLDAIVADALRWERSLNA